MTYRALVHDTGEDDDRRVARALRDHGYEVVLTDSPHEALHIDVIQEDVDLVYTSADADDQRQEVRRYGADPAWFEEPGELRLDWQQYDGIGERLAEALEDIPPFDPDPDRVADRLAEEYGNTGKALLAQTEL